MAYLNFQNCTKAEYETTLYSQDAKNKIKILFNNIELQDADKYCEKFTVKPRIMPNGSKVFGLNNFVAKEAELILHDIDTSTIQDKISISIGTLVNNTYEYVPIGIFNIQDTPTNDKNKTIIKLRDNAEKFDFNYNAKPIIDANNGTATKMQILEDICTKAEVTCAVDSFLGDTDLIGIYDNTITARQYVAYLAESAGCIATINREGELIFIYINNLTSWKIPLNIVEKYELAKNYTIGRVVFEDGIVRFETSQNEYDTLYLDASNPYISNQTQVENILSLVNGFEIDSFKTGNILGNPAIDGYDIIEVYGYYELLPNGNKRFIADEETIVAKTLATTELKYSGVLTNSFDTEIGEAERTNNITIIGEPTFKKWVKTEIDNVEGTLTTTVGQIGEQNEKISQITQSVNEINSKISDIADITTSGETSFATLNLVDVNESYPISIKIRPIGENISYLYPYNTLYPSSTTYLKTRTLRFTNTTTDDVIDWVLPTDLWYYSQSIYDEIELSYGDGTNPIVIATRRCQINADNTVSVLDTPTTETYPYPTNFVLTTGDYTITLLGYTNAYLYVQLMASNIYTTQFYTKAETESRISQTVDEIELGVSQTLSGYSTTSEMNAAINLKADEINSVVSRKVGINEVISRINQTPENITISANKVNISGVLTAINNDTTTTINGNKITTGSITSSKVDSSVITTSNLSAQTISGNQINGGTITGTTISGNTISGGTISGTTISGSSIRSGDIKIGSRETTIASNGDVSIYPDAGGVFRFAQGAARINSQYGVAITSNGGSGIYATDNNLDLKACYGAKAYLACMSGNGSGERSAVECANGTLYLRSAGTIYANGQAIGGSSSKATKENIKDLTKKQKQELVKLIENIPLKQYDYKKEYGKKVNYGFIIEDIEETKLNDLLHITQSEINKDIKTYSSEDLTRLELVVIQELIKKNRELEERIKKLERESEK